MTATRSARLVGAALCAALALVIVVWLLRDLAVFGPSDGLLRVWLGDGDAVGHDFPATSLVDPLLLVAYTAAAVMSLRSPLAAPVFTAVGVLTIALRLPGLWAAGTETLVTTVLSLGLATGLVVTAAAGRRVDRLGESGTARRPRRGPSTAAGVLCVVAGLALTGWELRLAQLLPSEFTVARFTGARTVLLSTLAVPPGWLNAVLVLLLLTAAGLAFARARSTRPLGLAAGLLLAGYGITGVAAVLRPAWYVAVPTPVLTTGPYELTALYALLAGVAVLVLLGGTWRPRPSPYRASPGLPPAPPAHRPPGW
ncbi:hypothetical protein [Streptomyces laurentii]|uniref:hypothetical protein n=1 Tax=Streptomyces laurentii TaxID=39478 RepID=UPI0036C72ED2